MKKLVINCPHCGNKTFWNENPSRPFCSERCRSIDLGSWASEEYSFAGEKAPQAEQDS
ncbi:MAG: DNA gyrase inhibitor YacG [Desulfuromusa sp.]|nr:DNA gyrase inhibitor YacG [Desulfuromusa sp.]